MNLYDLAYAIGVCLAAPYWLIKPSARRKVMGAFKSRMGKVLPRAGDLPAVMIHAVSLGEINATRELIRRLRLARPGKLHFIVSTTTETGFARGGELYGNQSDITLVRYPLDFSWAIEPLLDGLRPAIVVLMELEVWPNFLRHCTRRNIPVVVINGRLTSSSFKRYRMIRPLPRRMFSQLRQVCVQDENYARRFIELGADPKNVYVTGTMKFDIEVTDRVNGAGDLAAAVGLKAGEERLWVCGSTGPGEEKIILGQYRFLLPRFPALRLALVPRKPERFDEVADLIAASGFACVRRSKPTPAPTPAIILGDTMGELRAWYSLAEVVFVGRTLVDLGARQHGSDMIEPAALARPTIVGPFTGNFSEPMQRFLAKDAMKVVQSADKLGKQIAEFLNNPAEALKSGEKARQVVLSEQGATQRHVTSLLDILGKG